MFHPRRKEGLRQSPKEGKENWKMFVDRVKIHVKGGDGGDVRFPFTEQNTLRTAAPMAAMAARAAMWFLSAKAA